MSNIQFNVPIIAAPAVPVVSTFGATSQAISNAPANISIGVTSNLVNISSPTSAGFSVLSAPALSVGGGSLVNVASSPNLSLAAISANPLSGTPTTLIGAASTFGVPATISGAVSAFGAPTSVASAVSTLGVPNLSSGLLNTVKLQLPTIPSFPALDKVGVFLGAGPKFLAQKIASYTSIVPPFVPRLTISPAQIGAAIAIISAISSGNPGELLKQMLASVQKDLTSQALGALDGAISGAGVGDLQNQVSGIVSSTQNAAQSATPVIETSAEVSTTVSPIVPSTSLLDGVGSSVSSAVTSTTQPLSNSSAFTSPPSG